MEIGRFLCLIVDEVGVQICMIQHEDAVTSAPLVVVGASGRLGAALVRHFSHGTDLIGLGREELDLADHRQVQEVLEGLEFDRLILAAALTTVDYCEDHAGEAHLINAAAAGLIAEICAKKSAHMTYISTDFVFDGSKESPYTEEDETRAISVYGESKLAGERSVLAASCEHLVVRTSWLYGAGRAAFPEWIIQEALSKETLSLPAEKIGCPTSVEDLAELLEPLIFATGKPAGGVVHLCNSEPCSWLEWGQACLDLAGEAGIVLKVPVINAGNLEAIRAFVARRPVNSALSTSKYTRLTGIAPRPWRLALSEHLLRQHQPSKHAVA